MNRLENFSKPLIWSTALLLTAIVAGCGGGGGYGAPSTGGTPGSPAAVNLLSSSTYALTTSSGLSTTGVATFGGNAVLDAPTGVCTATPAAPTSSTADSCGLSTGVDATNAAVNTSGSLAITGTTIRYNPGTTPNSSGFNATVRAVKNDVNTAWLDAFNRAGATLIAGPGTLDGLTLIPGIYASASTMTLNGGKTLTLDAGGNANAVWIFQVGTALTVNSTTTAGSPTQVKLINGAQAKNVFWQVGNPTTVAGPPNGDVSFSGAGQSAADDTVFIGTILAGETVSFGGATTVTGRVLAGANLLNTPNTLSGAVTTTAASGVSVTVTLP